MMVHPVPSTLSAMAESLRNHPSIRSKLGIADVTRALDLGAESTGRIGDDAAALPNGAGWDLVAGEGFIPAFVADDPWFAGWCAVMVNLSDIAAMGGRATALVDQVWAPDAQTAAPVLQGLKDASATYGVPLVGGHTNLAAPSIGLATSVVGRATALITSFDAQPDDLLIAAVDHRGAYRNFDNFCAALDAPADRLRGDLDLLPALAEAYGEKGVELRGCARSLPLLPGAIAATDGDWSEEYLAPILAVRVVGSLDEAIEHINRYGSGHTDAIITRDYHRSQRFLREVDSSSVMVNASTRFADGFEYGLGAEIGISTDKLHARGPVGLEGLTSEKYMVLGEGQIRP